MVSWGILSSSMMWIRSEWAFYGVRFLLDVAEAGFFPGIIFYLTLWYPSRLRSTRTAWFVSAIAVSGVLGSPISGLVMDRLSGALGLFVLKSFVLQLLHRNTPEAAGMIGRFSITMVFVGLLQALAMWSLASRWIKLSMLYGGLGIAYWITLLCLGKSPADLLRVMPVAAGVAFGAVFLIWLIAMLTHKIGEPAQS